MRRNAGEQYNRLIKNQKAPVVFFIKAFQKIHCLDFSLVKIFKSIFLKGKSVNYLFGNLISILILVLISNSKGFILTIFL